MTATRRLIKTLRKRAYDNRWHAKQARTYEARLRAEGRADGYEKAAEWVEMMEVNR